MYAVVGCSNCRALWIVADRPETTSCPRCDSRHQFDRLEQFATTESKEAAREARAALLAAEQDRGEDYEALESVTEMESRIGDGVVGDETYLAESGLDPEAVAAAGQPQDSGPTGRREQILAAIDALEEPTQEAVVEYATDRGIPAERVREALEKLGREGTIVEGPAGYRRL